MVAQKVHRGTYFYETRFFRVNPEVHLDIRKAITFVLFQVVCFFLCKSDCTLQVTSVDLIHLIRDVFEILCP